MFKNLIKKSKRIQLKEKSIMKKILSCHNFKFGKIQPYISMGKNNFEKNYVSINVMNRTVTL